MPEIQTNTAGIGTAWDVLLDVGPPHTGPLHERLTTALRTAIRDHRISVGSALPPSRALADDLRCSRWAVTEAYGRLVAEGYLEARTGSGTRVRWSTDDAPAPPQPGPPHPGGVRFDLTPGLPDLRAFPRRQWADALQAQARTVSDAELGYPPPHGHPRLRELLAAHLRRSRGVRTTSRDVTVSTSVTEGVGRLCRAMAAEGITAVGCEEPGWTRLREVIAAAGLGVVPIRTDEQGLRVDDLNRHDGLRAVLVTPAHQFPTGTVLAPQRRAELLHWARRVDGLILEDDYDAEFRYDRRPVGAVQGMDPARVALVKSLSKTLSPALGIGWTVTPPRWTDLLRGVPAPAPPVLDQLAFASLLDGGAYDRHLRRVRQRYRHRRDALVDALGRHLPQHPVAGIAAGLHLLLPLPVTTDTAAVVRAAAARSLRLADLRGYHALDDRTVDDPAPHGLVLGYGNLADGAVDDAVRLLRDVMAG